MKNYAASDHVIDLGRLGKFPLPPVFKIDLEYREDHAFFEGKGELVYIIAIMRLNILSSKEYLVDIIVIMASFI